MLLRMTRPAAAALALSMGLSLAACGGYTANRTLYSVNQPVVSSTTFTLDLRTSGDGISIPEQKRLADWFDTMGLRYGDRVSLDDPTGSIDTRAAVAEIVGRYGLLISDGAPITVGYVNPGMARVVITRSAASVPGCPNWSEKMSGNYENATTSDYGCAVNSNIAAMVANPEHLIQGAESDGETYVSSGNKAINTYRNQAGKSSAAGGNTGGK